MQQAVREGGKYYLKGQIILLTAARAAEIGLDQVKPVGPPAKAATTAKPTATVTTEVPAPKEPAESETTK